MISIAYVEQLLPFFPDKLVEEEIKGASMTSVLTRRELSSTLTPRQIGMDSLWKESAKELGNATSILPVLMAGSAFRLGRAGVMSLDLAESSKAAFVLKSASYAVAFTAEISTYELSRRTLLSVGNPNASSLWKWEGIEGIKNGFLHSGITFGMLRASSSLATQNLILRHFIQDSSTVFAQDVASNFGIIPASPQSWMERMAATEVMNVQMMASLNLFAKGFPSHRFRELGMDLALDAYNQKRSVEKTRFENFLLERGRSLAWMRSAVSLTEEAPLKIDESTFEFLDWISARRNSGKDQRPLDLVRNALQTIQNPRNVSASQYDMARRYAEAFLGLQVIRDVYGLESMALDQFEKNFGRFKLVEKMAETPFRFSSTDQKPREISYTGNNARAKDSLEIALSIAGGSFESETTAASILSMQADENAVNHVWFYQALKFAEEVGARVRVKPISSLLEDFDALENKKDPRILERAIDQMRRRGIDSEAEQVLEITIPYGEVAFGEDKPYANKAFLSKAIADIEMSTQGAVSLIDKSHRLEAPIVMRIPSLSLFQEIVRQLHPENAATFFYMNGETSRDAMMRGREMGIAAVGMGFQPMILGDINEIKIPPWVYTLHDVFHAVMASQSSPAFRKFVAEQYRSLNGKPWAAGPLGEEYKAFLLDMNFEEKKFFNFSLRFVLRQIDTRVETGDLTKEDFVRALVFLDNYQKHVALQQGADTSHSPYFVELENAIHTTKAKVRSLKLIYQWLGLPGLKVRSLLGR